MKYFLRLAMIMETIHAWDQSLLRLINSRWSTSFFDWLMPRISHFWGVNIPLTIAGILLIVFGRFRERLLVVMALLLLLVGDVGIMQGIKNTALRQRPWHALEDIRHVGVDGVEMSQPQPDERAGSMPSAHTGNSTALAWLIQSLYWPWGSLMWVWVVLVSYSRVYTGNHYPSDVLAGFLVATIYTKILMRLSERVWAVAGPRWFARLYEAHPVLFPASASRKKRSEDATARPPPC